MQELVHGDEMEEGAQVHRVQDRRGVSIGDGRQGGRAGGRLRRTRRVAAGGRLPVRRVRLRFRHRRQLPEKQDLLHCVVRFSTSLEMFLLCLSGSLVLSHYSHPSSTTIFVLVGLGRK